MENKNIYDLYRSITPPNRKDILLMIDWLEDERPNLSRSRVAFEVVKELRKLSKTPKAIIMQTGSFWKGVGDFGGLTKYDPVKTAFIARRIDQANIPSI